MFGDYVPRLCVNITLFASISARWHGKYSSSQAIVKQLIFPFKFIMGYFVSIMG